MRRSEDSGATWSPVGPAMDFLRVACADDGRTLVALVTENSRREIYVSADSGATWTRRWAPAPAADWQKVAISGDGRTLIVVGQNNAGVVISRDGGVSWAVPASFPNAAGAIDAAFSTDGAKLVVVTYGYIYTSADAGETWSGARALLKTWKTVASSLDGVKLDALAEDGGLYTSLDSGVTWTLMATFAANGNPTIATSRDGVRLAAVQASGSVWTSTYAQAAAFLPVAEQGECDYVAAAGSSDGARLAFFCTLGTTTTTTLLTSDDYGDSWTRRDHGMALSGSIDDLASSSDGSRLFAAEYATDGGLWTSDDYGVTWTKRVNGAAQNKDYKRVAMSHDGQRLAVMTETVPINLYVSQDFGETWVARTFPNSAGSIFPPSLAMSGDGETLLAGTSKGSADSFNTLAVSHNNGINWNAYALSNCPYGVSAVAVWGFSASDPAYYAAACYNGNLYYLEGITTGGVWSPVMTAIHRLTSVAWSSDRSRLYAAQDESGYVWYTDDVSAFTTSAEPTWNYVSQVGGATLPSRRAWQKVIPVGADGARFAGAATTYAGVPGNFYAEQTPACDASAVAGHGDCPASLVVGATCWPGEAYCGAGDFEPPSDATYCGFDQVLHPSPCRFRPSCCDEALKRYGFEVRVRVKDEL